MSPSHCIERIGSDQDNIEIIAITGLRLDLGIGSLRGIVIGAKAPHPRDPRRDVVDEKKVPNLRRDHVSDPFSAAGVDPPTT